MAPKSGPSKERKLEMILTWFRDSQTCHPLKDLEAPLAKAASINKMQVKDFLKELTDENNVRVEKIGSVNWYWCWAGEEVRERKNVMAQLESEISKTETLNAELQSRMAVLKDDQSAVETDITYQQLWRGLGPLEEVKALADAEALKTETRVLTDNLYILEGYLLKLIGGDRDTLEAIRREFYGSLYVEGEGLAEIEEL